jgi:hypothetical protein
VAANHIGILPPSHFARSDFIAEEFSTGFKKQLTRIHIGSAPLVFAHVQRRFCSSVAAKRPQRSRFLVPFTPRLKPPKMAGVGDSSA